MPPSNPRVCALPLHFLPILSCRTSPPTLTLPPLLALHSDNLDYNSLKHEIKVHTTRDQATAIAIPGHQDATLKKFEDNLYGELCRQHDRVDLFITSKADEISRRLGEHLSFFVVGIRVHAPRILHFADGGFLSAEEYLASQIQRWVTKYSDANDSTISLKRQRRFAKYERELLRCGEEIHGLSRFANAQVVAFRKILKKYKVWVHSIYLTGCFSCTLTTATSKLTQYANAEMDGISNAVRSLQ